MNAPQEHVRPMPPLIPVPRAVKLMPFSRASAYRYAENGELPVQRFGRRVYVPRAKLAKLLQVEESELPYIEAELSTAEEAA